MLSKKHLTIDSIRRKMAPANFKPQRIADELRHAKRHIFGSWGKPLTMHDQLTEGMPQASNNMFRGMPAGQGVGPVQIGEFNRRCAEAWRSAPLPETIERLEREWKQDFVPNRYY